MNFVEVAGPLVLPKVTVGSPRVARSPNSQPASPAGHHVSSVSASMLAVAGTIFRPPVRLQVGSLQFASTVQPQRAGSLSFAPAHQRDVNGPGLEPGRDRFLQILVPDELQEAVLEVGRTCPLGHPLQAVGPSSCGNWCCDGRSDPGGCKSFISDFGQTQGIERFRCSVCDYDLCRRCFQGQVASEQEKAIEQETVGKVPEPIVVEMERHVPVQQVQTVQKPVTVTRVEARTVEKLVPQAVIEEELVERESHVLFAELIKEVPVAVTEQTPKEVLVPSIQCQERQVEIPLIDVVERMIEVPNIEYVEVITEMPKIEVQYIDKEVHVPQIQYVEKLVEVPHIIKRERIIEVPEVEIREVITEKPVPIVQYIPREVPAPSMCYEHKVVETTLTLRQEHAVEVPQALVAERLVQVPRVLYQDVAKEIPKYEMQYKTREIEVPQTIYAHRPVMQCSTSDEDTLRCVDMRNNTAGPQASYNEQPSALSTATGPGVFSWNIPLSPGHGYLHCSMPSSVAPRQHQTSVEELPRLSQRRGLFEQAQAERERFESALRFCDNEAIRQLSRRPEVC